MLAVIKFKVYGMKVDPCLFSERKMWNRITRPLFNHLSDVKRMKALASSIWGAKLTIDF